MWRALLAAFATALVSLQTAHAQGGLLDCARGASDDSSATRCLTEQTELSASATKEELLSCLDLYMSRGLYDATERLLDLAQAKTGVVTTADLSTAVLQASSRVSRRLQGLQDRAGRAANAAGIPPAFEWAQSPDLVYLNVKFSHKLDTPATLGCEADPPVFQAAGDVTFRAECKEKRKTFLLSLVTLKPLAVENCTWSMSSVGRASLTLRKAVNGTWPRLLAQADRKPPNMHVWWAMKEAHEEGNKAWEKEDAKRAKGGAEATPTPTPTPEAVVDSGAAAAAPSPTSAPPATPTPVPTPEDPVAALDRVKARELADAATGEAAELRALEAEAASKRKALEDKTKAERGVIEREAAEARRVATAKWEAARAQAQERHAAGVDAAKVDGGGPTGDAAEL